MYVLPHSPSWANEFEVEVKRLTSAYSGKIRYYHIGSTAIPGLMAKDCIDILGIVSDLPAVTHARDKFESIGYDARGA